MNNQDNNPYEDPYNSSAVPDPYQSPENDLGINQFPNRRTYPPMYWGSWAITVILSIVVAAITQGLGLFLTVAMIFGWIRSGIFSNRQYHSSLPDSEIRCPSDQLAASYFASLGIGLLVAFAMTGTFVAICIPSGLVVFSAGGDSGLGISVVFLISFLISLLVSVLILRATAGRPRSMKRSF